MNNMSRFVLCMIALIITALVPVKMAWSADDNASVAQVYLEFDPATGQFVSVPATTANSPDGAETMGGQTNTHTASPQDPAAQTPTTVASQTTAAGQTDVSGSAGNAATGGMSTMVIGSIFGFALLGGIVLMMRKKPA